MRLASIGLALAAAACAQAPPEPSMGDAASLAAAESAFAAHSVREDMRAAFLANFSAEGVLVRDGWTRALPYLAARPAPPIVLDWRPAHVEVAASGELGLSTGPWKLASRARPEAPVSRPQQVEDPRFGQFVSVWRREAEGAWKVLVDIGIGNPGPALWDEELRTVPAAPGSSAAATPIEAAERAFAARAASAGLAAAYREHGAERLRLYRAGAAPAAGKTRAVALLAQGTPAAAPSWIVEASGTSRAGDFAYVRGRCTGAPRDGHFLRVWRVEDGAWRIVMDVVDESC